MYSYCSKNLAFVPNNRKTFLIVVRWFRGQETLMANRVNYVRQRRRPNAHLFPTTENVYRSRQNLKM